jgi:hypothetical protein
VAQLAVLAKRLALVQGEMADLVHNLVLFQVEEGEEIQLEQEEQYISMTSQQQPCLFLLPISLLNQLLIIK